jgi:hypothetical protein
MTVFMGMGFVASSISNGGGGGKKSGGAVNGLYRRVAENSNGKGKRKRFNTEDTEERRR